MSISDSARQIPGVAAAEGAIAGAFRATNRATITDRVGKLLGEQPWAGYDEQDVDAVADKLNAVDSDTARKVKSYERDRKDRAGVIQAADKRLARS